MSGIGSSEFILLLVIGLIVLGPKRLPEIANKIGGWIGQARRMTRVMKRQLEDELNLDAHKSILPPTSPFATEQKPPVTPPPVSAAEADPELPDTPPTETSQNEATGDDSASSTSEGDNKNEEDSKGPGA